MLLTLPFLFACILSDITSANLLIRRLNNGKLALGDKCPKWYTKGACCENPSTDAGLSISMAPIVPGMEMWPFKIWTVNSIVFYDNTKTTYIL